ncbi:MAG TPA: peroxidase family protein [Thermoanaerobaculia bacterium]|nr:peroxidase family protein [Thermoanaerobaculia bacterium]
MRAKTYCLAMGLALLLSGCSAATRDCVTYVKGGFRPIAKDRAHRFLGKVRKETASCRGGERAVAARDEPWLDWQNYYATGGPDSRHPTKKGMGHLSPNGLGVDGALLDLEYQRIELVKFNLLDNSGTYKDYTLGRDKTDGPAIKTWPEMRLPADHPSYQAVGGDGKQQCWNDLVRFRSLTGICNDIFNPLMGSTNTQLARNVQFEATFPDLSPDQIARNRHGDRISLMTPDPAVISRRLFTRAQSQPDKCNQGFGLPGNPVDANCDYQKAPFFNVLAAFWIQFMTHDWFSHMSEGKNDPSQMIPLGCVSQKVNGVETPLTPEQAKKLGCRPEDRIDKGLIAQDDAPPTFSDRQGNPQLKRAYKTSANKNTAWWDASQIYGYDETSRKRVKRDPNDRAKLLLEKIGDRPGAGEALGYLPLLQPNDPMIPQWAGQEATGFPDNWTIGMSFYTNVFAREHNAFVDEFRTRAAAAPDDDSGLRNPANPAKVIAYKDVTDDELFEVGRLVVSAMIAKIHTIEWTPQLLYNEPLFLAMNANWSGLFGDHPLVSRALGRVVRHLNQSQSGDKATAWYSVFASGPGIVGTGSHDYAKFSKKDRWSLTPEYVNGGVNHFGSPFNFPEEFVTVYRLHPLVPDLIEYRDWSDPNAITAKVPVIETFRGKASTAMRDRGLANWALSMGRQRLGLLTLGNHAQFQQNITLPRLQSPSNPEGKIDMAALDLLRDREHGVPRFNEFRRQYGLKQLRSFDDFIDKHLDTSTPEGQSELERQQDMVTALREIYGQHKCDASKVITTSQVNDDGSPINDCLGLPNGTMVDNIEDVDTVVGWLAEFRRPWGFAISETQFQVFILNASRRLFSDRFFTSSFRPEFYSTLGYSWVNNNGPGAKQYEPKPSNGHKVEVSPLKRVLMRSVPELTPELRHVVNAFDPWARDRGEYYSLDWKPRPDVAGKDIAFEETGPAAAKAVPASPK